MNDAFKREVSITIAEIAAAEQAFHQQGIDIADQDEWQQLRDITNRMIAKLTIKEPAE